MKNYRCHVLIAIDDSALQSGVKEFETALHNELVKNKLEKEIYVLETGSFGFFGQGISLMVYPEKITYVNLKISDVPKIVEKHFLKGQPVKDLMEETIPKIINNYDFNYKNRIVLENSGIINPEDIERVVKNIQ